MISSKTIELIKTFSDTEFKEFGFYVNSPYFNRERILIDFYNILKKYYPAFENRGFNKVRIFSKLYPGKKYNDGVMRNILSNLGELAENFLAFKNLQSKKIENSLSLLNELSIRKQEKLYEKELAVSKTLINEIKTHDEVYYDFKYMLELVQRDYKSRLKSSLNLIDENLINMAEFQQIAFLIKSLKTRMFLVNMNRNMFGYNKQNGESSDYLNNESVKYYDVIYVRYYFNSYMLAITEDEKYFYELKDIIINNFDELNEADKKDIFSVLTNFCYVKTNKGDLKFTSEHFSLLRQNVEKGYYKGGQSFMSHIYFLNVVITGLEAGEFEWVWNFIENYTPELDEKNRENTNIFCMALFNYHKRDYSKAIEEASKVKADDLSYKHQLKSLYLKIYFDMNNYESFYSHVDTYKHFIKFDKHVTQANKEVLSNYINFTKKLFDIKNNPEDKDFDFIKLKKEIIDSKSMINKSWLLRKIDEIKSSFQR